MIKLQTTSFLSAMEREIKKYEISTEDACRFIHDLSWSTRASGTIICETDEDKKKLIRTYNDMYHDEFNVQHPVDDEEQRHLQLAYPAETDVFYVENMFFRFEAGIRELDPRYARVNSHQTIFIFQVSPIYECIAINNEQDEKTKTELAKIKEYVIYKNEQLNHLSYEDAKEYLKYVWSEYQEFFQNNSKVPDLERINEVNKNFDLPWDKRY